MRHFVGFLSGLILGPVLLLVTGWAFAHLRGLHASGQSLLQGSGPVALAGLVALGLLVALVAVPPRLTPLLPFAAALVLGGATATALTRMHLLERLPVLPGTEGALDLLPLGVFVPLVLVLAVPVFVGARWVREDDGPTEEEYFEGLHEDGEGGGLPRRSSATRAEPVAAHHEPRHRLEED